MIDSDIRTGNEDWDKVAINFLELKAPLGAKGKENTRKAYTQIVLQFIEVAKQHHNGSLPHFSELDRDIVPLFLREPIMAKRSKQMVRRKKADKDKEDMIAPSEATVDRRLNVLSGFFDVAIYYDLTDKNLARNWRAMRPKSSDRSDEDHGATQKGKALNPAEARAFFKAIPAVSWKEDCAWKDGDPRRVRHQLIGPAIIARNELIFYLFEATGIRIEGMEGLDIYKLDIDKMNVTVTEKRQKTRTVPIIPTAITLQVMRERLVEWLEVYRPMLSSSKRSTSSLWLTQHGNKLGRRSIQAMCSQAMESAGLTKPNFGPHLLRHTFATDRLEAGDNPRDVAMVLGHNGLGTIKTYDSGDMDAAVKRMRGSS